MLGSTNIFTILHLSRAFETFAQINKELKKTEFDGAFCKTFKLHLFAKHRKSVENKIQLKSIRKLGITECPRSLNLGKAMTMAFCPIIVHLLLSVRIDA